MSDADGQIYEDLAECHERLRELRQRDQFLVLAADAALMGGRKDHAERLRGRLLQVSPNHMLRPYPTFADAMQSPDIQDYIAGLRQQFPPMKASRLLDGMRQGDLIVAASPGPAPEAATDLGEFGGGRSSRGPGSTDPGGFPFGAESAAARPAPVRPAPQYVTPKTPVSEQPRSTNSRPAGVEPELTWIPTLLFVLVLALAAFLTGYGLFIPWLRP